MICKPLTLAAGTACECDDCNGFLLFDNAYVEASVVRAADASPVAGAVVRVSRDSVALLEGTTGADGVVLLTIVMSSDSVPIVVGVVPPPPLLEGPPQTATLRSGDTARFTFSLAAAAR